MPSLDFGNSKVVSMMVDSFWIGVYPGMTKEMIDYMGKVIKEGLEQNIKNSDEAF
jgi:hypothetical protein